MMHLCRFIKPREEASFIQSPQWILLANIEIQTGGQSSLADYCAYFVAYSDGSCTDSNGARAPDQMLGEIRGRDSRCMSSSLVRKGFVRGTLTQGNGCYQHRCKNASLEVSVDGIWKRCPEKGGPIEFSGFNGELICPPFEELCGKDDFAMPGQCLNACSMNGECVDSKCNCFLGYTGADCSISKPRQCPNDCSGHGSCTPAGFCKCEGGYTGADCSTAGCDEQCSLHGGVCDNGVCEFRCSDYAGYTCQNSSGLLSSLSICSDVLVKDAEGQHCAPSEASILQQLEAAVVLPNYNRLLPNVRYLWRLFDNGNCAITAKRLACWISIQRCDQDGDNRLRVCHSACMSYNSACGARLDCSDRTLFSGMDEEGVCTGDGGMHSGWHYHLELIVIIVLGVPLLLLLLWVCRHTCWSSLSVAKPNDLHILLLDGIKRPHVNDEEFMASGSKSVGASLFTYTWFMLKQLWLVPPPEVSSAQILFKLPWTSIARKK